MLLTWTSTSENLVAYAIRNLPETAMLHVQEILPMPSAALSRFLEPNREAEQEKVVAYETHVDVWPYLRGQNTGADFNSDQDKWVNGLLNCIVHCLGGERDVCITMLPGRRGYDETLHNLLFLLYSLGAKAVKTTMLYERQDQAIIDSCNLPCGYIPRVSLNDPDVLMLLIVHSLLSEGRAIKGLSNVSQIRDMLMKRKLTRYLPAKKRKRNADGYYKALQRASKEMVDCSMLSHSSVRRKDEYSITTLGMSCLKIAKSVSAMLGKDGQRIIDNYEKVAEEVTSYERQP
jgi:hypothetical protein